MNSLTFYEQLQEERKIRIATELELELALSRESSVNSAFVINKKNARLMQTMNNQIREFQTFLANQKTEIEILREQVITETNARMLAETKLKLLEEASEKERNALKLRYETLEKRVKRERAEHAKELDAQIQRIEKLTQEHQTHEHLYLHLNGKTMATSKPTKPLPAPR